MGKRLEVIVPALRTIKPCYIVTPDREVIAAVVLAMFPPIFVGEHLQEQAFVVFEVRRSFVLYRLDGCGLEHIIAVVTVEFIGGVSGSAVPLISVVVACEVGHGYTD